MKHILDVILFDALPVDIRSREWYTIILDSRPECAWHFRVDAQSLPDGRIKVR